MLTWLWMLVLTPLSQASPAETAPPDTSNPAPSVAPEVAALQQEVAALKQRVEQLESRPSGISPMDFSASSLSLGLMGSAGHELTLQQPRFLAAPQEVGTGFFSGALALYVTGNVQERFRFLAEVVLEYDEDQEVVLDPERILGTLDIAEWLSVSIGRGHTALGYWNQRFHHGVWLQTTADRPTMYEFEDDAGILPVHYVGLEFRGKFHVPYLDLEYTANVANGRGTNSRMVQNTRDINLSKALSLMVEAKPQGYLNGLVLGATVYADEIPRSAETQMILSGIPELIWGAHAAYVRFGLELIVEGKAIHHWDGRRVLHHAAGYAQAAFKFRSIKPYGRVDVVALNSLWGGPDDPFFTPEAGFDSSLQHTLGVRWDFTSATAAKLEVRRWDGPRIHNNSLVLQVSFSL